LTSCCGINGNPRRRVHWTVEEEYQEQRKNEEDEHHYRSEEIELDSQYELEACKPLQVF
jgi:hypothetical protein